MDRVLTLTGDRPGKQWGIDLADPFQRRYEMLRDYHLSADAAEVIARRFDHSRAGLYQWLERYQEEGWAGLLPQKPGPKGPTKRTPELDRRVIELRYQDRERTIYDLAELLEPEAISTRTIARILAEHGLTRKRGLP